MKRYKSIINNTLLFLLTNIVGSFIGPLCERLAVFYFIEISDENYNLESQQHFLGNVMLLWLTCALFSISIFFFRGRWKIFFGSMPILIPLVYSLLYLKNFL